MFAPIVPHGQLELVIVGFVMFRQIYSLHTAVEVGSSLPIQICI